MSKQYIDECNRILRTYKDEMLRLHEWENCEYEYGFLGFLEVYQNLNIPKDFTIIDLGCYQACQCIYFKEYKQYIGVDAYVPLEYRFRQDNAIYVDKLIEDYIEQYNGDLNKTFAICSYVPVKDNVYNRIKEKFPYHKIQYCNTIISEKFPKR
ncbi:MAG: hypothetical protein VZS44_11345 [Bacilli bacterium]|nr:hypothetical protein [Bacilli bacterium]